MTLQGKDVVGQVVSLRLARLRGHVARVQPDRRREADGSRYLGQQKARHDARVEAAGPNDDQVGLLDGMPGVVSCSDVGGGQPDPVDSGGSGDLRLARDLRPVAQPRVQRHRRGGRRNDLTSNRENAVHLADALLEVVPLNRRHGRQEQVADGVPAQARFPVTGESVLQELAHQWLGVRQRDDAVANVPDGRDPQLLAQTPGRTAVVCDRHHGGDVAGVLLDAPQEGR